MNTIKMIVSLFTREGRQDVARMLIKPYLSTEVIAREMAHGISALLDKGTAHLTDSKCANISTGCKLISIGVSSIGSSISPESEGGKTISEGERVKIESKLREGMDMVITPEMLNDIAECVISRIR